MAESLLTKQIKIALYYYTRAHFTGVYGAFEVAMGANTMGYGNEFVDFLTMDSNSVFRCYEIKISKEDLHSKANLSFYGDFNYLVVPNDLFDYAMEFVKARYMKDIGIIVYDPESASLHLRWKCKQKRLRIEQRIANMYNMVRSGSRFTTKWVIRERDKLFRKEDSVMGTDGLLPGLYDDE